jgi:hypothetical protein
MILVQSLLLLTMTTTITLMMMMTLMLKQIQEVKVESYLNEEAESGVGSSCSSSCCYKHQRRLEKL